MNKLEPDAFFYDHNVLFCFVFGFPPPAVFGFILGNMNRFLLRSGEMFRFVAVSGRFASLSQNWTAARVAGSTSRCVRTLQGSGLNSVRRLCERGARVSDCNESLQVPDSAASRPDPRATFFQELRESRSPSDVLDLVDRCDVAPWCISNSLSRMWHTTKKMSDEQRRWELRLMAEHPTFEKLCHGARVNAPRMHSHNLAFTLLALVKLGVSQSSYVVQTVLRAIQVFPFTLAAWDLTSQPSDQTPLPLLVRALSPMVVGSHPRTTEKPLS